MQPTKLLSAALMLCGLCNFTNQAHGATGKLLAGTAKVSITPVTDEPLHDPVFARSLVLEIDHERLAFVSVDLGVFTSTNVETVYKEVGVIRVEDTNGQPRAIMMNYACHADVVCLSYAISADYPGVAARKVEEAFGKGVNCLFVNGAAGNVAPLFTVPRKTSRTDPFITDYAPMEKMGELLAYETVKVAKSLTGKP